VPLQSLALLNSDFAVTRGDAFAQRLIAETSGQTQEIIRRAWRVAIGREPTESETPLASDFVEAQRALYAGDMSARWAVADFCQMLLASNAFLYLE
jgi:hypothetical protein